MGLVETVIEESSRNYCLDSGCLTSMVVMSNLKESNQARLSSQHISAVFNI